MTELDVVPAELAGAAGAILAVASSLDDALSRFAAVAHGCVDAFGTQAADAALATWQTAARAVDDMAANLRTYAEGLAAAAEHYARTDATAVPR